MQRTGTYTKLALFGRTSNTVPYLVACSSKPSPNKRISSPPPPLVPRSNYRLIDETSDKGQKQINTLQSLVSLDNAAKRAR